jgi:hypothetical protein
MCFVLQLDYDFRASKMQVIVIIASLSQLCFAFAVVSQASSSHRWRRVPAEAQRSRFQQIANAFRPKVEMMSELAISNTELSSLYVHLLHLLPLKFFFFEKVG